MSSYTIICSTNRKNALSKIISQIYQDLLSEEGMESQIIDLTDLPPDFTQSALYENAGKNADFNKFRQLMYESQKFVFIIPEYNGSFPGVLKAFIDGLKYPGTFQDKKAALIGLSSGSQGGSLALSHLTDILNYCGTHVLALKPKLAKIESKMNDKQEITDSLYDELLRTQVAQFVKF